jgi:hypothetical protein
MGSRVRIPAGSPRPPRVSLHPGGTLVVRESLVAGARVSFMDRGRTMSRPRGLFLIALREGLVSCSRLARFLSRWRSLRARTAGPCFSMANASRAKRLCDCAFQPSRIGVSNCGIVSGSIARPFARAQGRCRFTPGVKRVASAVDNSTSFTALCAARSGAGVLAASIKPRQPGCLLRGRGRDRPRALAPRLASPCPRPAWPHHRSVAHKPSMVQSESPPSTIKVWPVT